MSARIRVAVLAGLAAGSLLAGTATASAHTPPPRPAPIQACTFPHLHLDGHANGHTVKLNGRVECRRLAHPLTVTVQEQYRTRWMDTSMVASVTHRESRPHWKTTEPHGMHTFRLVLRDGGRTVAVSPREVVRVR